MRTRIMLVRDRRHRASPVVDTPQAAFNFIRPQAQQLDREYLWRIDLDGHNNVLGYEVVSIGTLTASLVHPREVLKGALLANAAAFVLAHNHPSGDENPSAEDRETTRRMKNAGELMGIPMVDHLIVTDGKFFSFRERGLL